ncbi:MAG: AraC family transcriptional regulator [Paludibacteraceae bacterium]|nr:AraC family transcriptional regulator [Paludibacteraceae bacterium]
MLLKHSLGNLPRLIMGISCLGWFVVEIAFLNFLVQGENLQSPAVRFHPSFIFLTFLVTKITLLYPFALLNPSRVVARRMLKYALPGGVLCILYILHTSFCPKPVRPDVLINMVRDVVAGLTDPVEFVLLCLLIIYLALDVIFTIVKLLRFVPLYDKMLDQNFSNVEYYQVSWVRRVVYPVMLVIALLLAYLTIPGQTVSLVLGASHLLVLAIVLFLTVDSALSMEQVNPSLFPKLYWDYRTFSWKFPEDVGGNQNETDEMEEETQLLTEQQIENYKKVFEEWMNIVKPYNKSEFRVSDVHKKLGIGRLEANEFFNRAYHCYFRNLVQRYRIEESIRMMKEFPEKQIKEISYEVGFSSQSVFARSFQNQMGMSCTRYREKMDTFR